MISRFFKQKPQEAPARDLYTAIVERSRTPVFYQSLGVPDTLDGRFEMLALHTFLVLNRLKRAEAEDKDLAQAVFDVFFQDMDESLREMGAGDLGVGRRVKAMAQAFYGRISAYETGLAEGTTALQAAIARNAYGTAEARPDQVLALANYLQSEVDRMAAGPLTELRAGRLTFGPLPESPDAA